MYISVCSICVFFFPCRFSSDLKLAVPLRHSGLMIIPNGDWNKETIDINWFSYRNRGIDYHPNWLLAPTRFLATWNCFLFQKGMNSSSSCCTCRVSLHPSTLRDLHGYSRSKFGMRRIAQIGDFTLKPYIQWCGIIWGLWCSPTLLVGYITITNFGGQNSLNIRHDPTGAQNFTQRNILWGGTSNIFNIWLQSFQ